MTTDTYSDWMARMMAGRDGRPLAPNDVVRTPGGTPFAPIEFLRTDREKYVAEIGQRGNDFIYHFYPSQDVFSQFEEAMAQAFLETFKLEDRVQADYVPEFHSWVVRAAGFAINPLSDTLATKVFDVLDKKLA